MARSRNSRGSGGALRVELLGAARRLLEEAGSADAITVRSVAEACGVSQASIYLHFISCDELVHEVALEVFNAYYDERVERIAALEDPVERITRYGLAYTDFALDNRRLFHALLMGDGNERDPGRFDGLDLLRRTRLGGMVDEVARAMEAGAIAPGDPGLVACMLWMSMHGAAALLISLPGYLLPPTETTIAAMVSFTANAVRHPIDLDPMPR